MKEKKPRINITNYDEQEMIFVSGEFLSSHADEMFEANINRDISIETPLKLSERYQKIALLGEGGMGRVWLGWDATIERNVAIKEPHHDAPAHIRAKLMREVTLTAKLDHPGVVAIHDILYDEDESPLFIMALVRGQTLANLMTRRIKHQQGAVDQTLLRHVLQACEIVGHAHQRGILHRDITPRNIIIEDNGTTRVIDWGLAITREEAQHKVSSAGTPGYMSPEQHLGAPLEPSSDVWSLGALLFTILYGQVPDTTQDQKPREQLTPLEAICLKAMNPQPTQRYPDASAMAEDMIRWFEGQRVEALEMTSLQITRWVLTRYRRPIAITMSIVLLVGMILGMSVWFAKQEATRAGRAEQLAIQQRQRADKASTLAIKQADDARHASKTLALYSAKQALNSGDILDARRLLKTARTISNGPRVKGLEMQLTLIPRPQLKHIRTLSPCAGKRMLTFDPMIQLCHLPNHTVEAWHGNELTWRVDLAVEMASFHQHNGIANFRITPDQLVVRGTLIGALGIELSSGRIKKLATDATRFGSLQKAHLLDFKTLSWVDMPESAPCGKQLIHAYRGKTQNHYLCHNGIWITQKGKPTQHIDTYDARRAHLMVQVPSNNQYWLASSDGTLWPMGRRTHYVKLGGPVQRLFAIPKSTYIAVQTWGGIWRILETSQGDWMASFGENVQSLHATQSGFLQGIVGDQLKIWSLPQPKVMRRYRDQHGFTDVAWSDDGRVLGASSGGALIHHIQPFEHKTTKPIITGRDVAKSVTPLRDGGFVVVNSIVSEDNLKGLIRVDERRGQLIQSQLDEHAKLPTPGRRVERMYNDNIILLTIAGTLVFIKERLSYSSSHALSKMGEFYDVDTDAGRKRAIAVGKTSIKFIDAHGNAFESTAPPGAYYGTIESSGRYALTTKQGILIYRPTGELERHIATTALTAIEWRDGTEQILTGHRDGTMRVWDVQTGSMLAELPLHQGRLASIDISPTHPLVATASWDTTVQITSLKPLESQ